LALTFGLSALYISRLKYDLKASENEDHLEHFTEFAAKFNKNFGDSEEFQKRFDTFKNNLRHVEEHNSKNGFNLGVNMFSDLSEEEFLDIYGNKETENDHPIVERSSRRSQTNDNPQERWEEDPERVA